MISFVKGKTEISPRPSRSNFLMAKWLLVAMRPTFLNLLHVVRRSRSYDQTSICRQRVSFMLRHDDFVMTLAEDWVWVNLPASKQFYGRRFLYGRSPLIRQGPAGRSSVSNIIFRSGYTRAPQVEHGGCNRIEAQATLAWAKVAKSAFRLSTASIYATIFLATARIKWTGSI